MPLQLVWAPTFLKGLIALLFSLSMVLVFYPLISKAQSLRRRQNLQAALLTIATAAQIVLCLNLVKLHPIFMLIIIFGVIYPLCSIASEFERDIWPMLESDDECVRGIAIIYE